MALVLIGSGMVALAYWLPWGVLFAAAAAILAGLGLLVQRVPRLDVPAEARQRWLAPFVSWIGTWRAVPLVAFVLTYKLGEFAIGPMVKPFWVDQGRSLLEIGLVPTALGITLSIAGALAGGAFMQRYGTLTALWALGLPQALSNLGYAAVATYGLPWPALYGASMLDSFAGGLGTAAFLGFFLAVCDPERATLQYAFLSSLFSLTGRLAGAVSGIGAEQWGYGTYFALTFVASLPGLCLVPFVASWLPARPARPPAMSAGTPATPGPGELLAFGFEGTTLPEAISALVDEAGLGGIVLFTRNCPDLDTVAGPDRSRPSAGSGRAGPPGPRRRSRPSPAASVHPLSPGRRDRAGGRSGAGRRGGPGHGARAARGGVRLRARARARLPDRPRAAWRSATVRTRAIRRRSPPAAPPSSARPSRRGSSPVAKHFPGHGRTAVDSHLALPEVDAPLGRARSGPSSLPFRRALAAGCPAVLMAHVRYPALDPEWPASMSPEVIGGLLRRADGLRRARPERRPRDGCGPDRVGRRRRRGAVPPGRRRSGPRVP